MSQAADYVSYKCSYVHSLEELSFVLLLYLCSLQEPSWIHFSYVHYGYLLSDTSYLPQGCRLEHLWNNPHAMIVILLLFQMFTTETCFLTLLKCSLQEPAFPHFSYFCYRNLLSYTSYMFITGTQFPYTSHYPGLIYWSTYGGILMLWYCSYYWLTN